MSRNRFDRSTTEIFLCNTEGEVSISTSMEKDEGRVIHKSILEGFILVMGGANLEEGVDDYGGVIHDRDGAVP